MSGATFREPAFYSYTYPEPAGYRQASIRPSTARYDDRLGEFIFPYKDARTAAPPERAIMDFFQSTYEAGATLGHWDRERLESRAAARPEQPSAPRTPSRGLRTAQRRRKPDPAGPSGG